MAYLRYCCHIFLEGMMETCQNSWPPDSNWNQRPLKYKEYYSPINSGILFCITSRPTRGTNQNPDKYSNIRREGNTQMDML
jgi:hypothetical protein